MTQKQKIEVVQDAVLLLDEFEIASIYKTRGKHEIYLLNVPNRKFDIHWLKSSIIDFFEKHNEIEKLHHTYINDLTKQILFVAEVVL